MQSFNLFFHFKMWRDDHEKKPTYEVIDRAKEAIQNSFKRNEENREKYFKP